MGTKTSFFSQTQPGGMINIEDQSISTGTRWFVHSGTGTDGLGYGRNPDFPTATIDYAIGLATASVADIIYVMPGHTEDLDSASDITFDKIGATIIGLGEGTNRPTLTYTAADATIVMSAVATRISNIRFIAGIDDVANFVTMSVGDNHIDNCLFQGPGSFQWINAITLTTTKDNFSIKDCVFEQKTDVDKTNSAAGTGAIFCIDSENIIIDGCIFYDQIETAGIHNRTTACKNLWVTNCRFYCTLSDMTPLELVDGATGAAVNCGGANPNSADVTDLALWGVIASTFWITPTSSLGNDSAAGGQGSANAQVAT